MMTALGPINLSRSHSYCRVCHQAQFAADLILGIDGWMSVGATRMASVAGLDDSFDKASSLLSELSGWSICADSIRRCCHRVARNARRSRAERGGSAEQFSTAAEESSAAELHIDAGKVNTPEGWRDVKVAAFAVRPIGEPSDCRDYTQRELPEPTARSVVAEIEPAAEFADRCTNEARRLVVPAKQKISVLGDGAEWIWNLAGQRFAGSREVLDIYHALEHLADAAREAFGKDEEGFDRWLDTARVKLVGDGYLGACEAMTTLPTPPEGNDSVPKALNYLCGHRDRLNYAAGLIGGLPIGSGLVEGTIKQRVNVRMKRCGARWLPQHVGPFVELLAMKNTPEWSEFWNTTAA